MVLEILDILDILESFAFILQNNVFRFVVTLQNFQNETSVYSCFQCKKRLNC